MRTLYKTSLQIESHVFLKSINIWCTTSLYSYFFSPVLDESRIYDHSWPVASKSAHTIPCNFLAYEVNLDSRMLDKILYVVDGSDKPLYNYYDLVHHPAYKEVQWSTPSTPQAILLTPNRNDSLWILERIVLPSALISSVAIWLIPGDLHLWSFSTAISTSKALSSGSSGSAVCSVCLTSLTFRHGASCILGQEFRYSPENVFYIFNQQIYFIIWYLLDRASLI